MQRRELIYCGSLLRYIAIKLLGPGSLDLPCKVVSECLAAEGVKSYAEKQQQEMSDARMGLGPSSSSLGRF